MAGKVRGTNVLVSIFRGFLVDLPSPIRIRYI